MSYIICNYDRTFMSPGRDRRRIYNPEGQECSFFLFFKSSTGNQIHWAWLYRKNTTSQFSNELDFQDAILFLLWPLGMTRLDSGSSLFFTDVTECASNSLKNLEFTHTFIFPFILLPNFSLYLFLMNVFKLSKDFFFKQWGGINKLRFGCLRFSPKCLPTRPF